LDYFVPEKSEVKLKEIAPVLIDGYIAIAIGGQHHTKILPAEKLIGLISKMVYPVVLLGDMDDYKRGEEVLKGLNRKNVFNGCGLFSLDQSASIIEQSLAVISNDTGLMHIAAAFNKPIVSIWGNTIPAFGMYPYVPENPSLSVISEVKELKCRPCSKLGYKKCPKKHFKCMMDQDEEVIAESISNIIPQSL
jgi:heptosyltransferase-2